MTKKRTDQTILIDIALKLRVKPRATHFDKEWSLIMLDYSFLKLSELPPEIGLFSNLKVLNLDGNLLTTLPAEIGLLSELTTLSLASNKLQKLPLELWDLTNLITLDVGVSGGPHVYDSEGNLIYYDEVDDDDYDEEDDDEDNDEDEDFAHNVSIHYETHSENSISMLPKEIRNLKNLRTLDLQANQLQEIPIELCLLPQLQTLNLAQNQLTELPVEIGQLIQLENLYLHSNQLTRIPKEISQLFKLKTLYLHDNKLVKIPVEIGQLEELESFEVHNNPDLLVPPPEIVEQPTSQILEYLRELQSESIIRFEAKMLLVGEGGTGKSTLLRVLRGEKDKEPLATTHGIEIGTYKVPDPDNSLNEITLNTWDFGGQQIYHATHQFFLTRRSLYLIVWNARLGADQGRLHYWLDTIRALAPDSPILLVATHIDERAPDLNYNLYKEAYPQLIGSVSVSNHTGAGLAALSEHIASVASRLPLMGQPWPRTWMSAEDCILSLADHHISAAEYIKHCEQSGVPLRVAVGTLGDFLHDLGKIMYFRDDYILRNLIVLKPNWVTKAISRVLTDHETGEAKGILSHSELPRIWKEDESGNAYEPHLYSIFLRLMERFDLSYQIEADTPGDHPTRSLVPQLLPHEPPVKLPPWPQNPQRGESLIEMLYNLDFVPAGIMSWFIVRTHPYTRNLHWREGVLLKYEGHQARVEMNPMLRELRLVVWGPQPHNFFTILMNTVDLILSRFEGLKIRRDVPCICHWERSAIGRCPRYYPYEDLVRRMSVGKHTIECNETFKRVSVPTLLYGIHPSTDEKVMADINLGYQEIKTRLEKLNKLDLILEKLAQQSELIGRNFTRQWNLEMQKLEAECPSTFWLATHGTSAFNPKDWVSQQYKLYLLCQHPPSPHTVGDGYPLRQSQDWWLTVSPWLNQLIKFIKFGVPMGKAVGAVYDETAFEKFKTWAALMEEIAKAIPQLTKSLRDTMELDLKSFDIAQDQQSVGAALRVLYHFLDQADAAHKWGDLSRVVTPDGNILWLCAAHRQQYEAKPLILEPAVS